MLAIASSGNLSITQAVIGLLSEGFANPETGETETLAKATSMFQRRSWWGRRCARSIASMGRAWSSTTPGSRFASARRADQGPAPAAVHGLLGHFIEATADTPFLQIGEHKYGKPVLDRAVKYETEIYDALKIGLISMDSTMRSNLAVGLPIDILVLRRDTLVPELSYRITAEDHYFSDLRHRWSEALREAHLAIPQPPYKTNAKR